MRRKLGALVAALAVTAGAAGLVPTSAAATTYYDVLVYIPGSGTTGATVRNGVKSPATMPAAVYALPGHFKTGSDGQLFLYNPGAGADGILNVSISGSGTTSTFTSKPVSGTYQPFVGDFDGNGVDDIYWYAPGAAADSIWLQQPDGSHTNLPANVGGTYRPLVLDTNVDNRDDIVWYGLGSTPDSIWRFGAGATSHTVKTVSIGGDYVTAVGHFGLRDPSLPYEGIVFYNPSGTDYQWEFNAAGTPTSYALPTLDGNYRLLPGRFFEESDNSLYFYGPGSLPEKWYAFGPGPGPDLAILAAPNISGTYTTQTGDFDANGYTDIAFLNGSSTTSIWKFDFDGQHPSVVSGLPSSNARVVSAA